MEKRPQDGPLAWDVTAEFRPEVVLLDIGLPGMDGPEVAPTLRGRPEFAECLPVALTGEATARPPEGCAGPSPAPHGRKG